MKLTSDDLSEVLYEVHLPAEFSTQQGIDERSIHIKHDLGEVKREQVWFSGVHLSYGSLELNQPIRVKAELDTPIIEMHFSLQGASRTQLAGNMYDWHTFDNQQHNLIYAPHFEGKIEVDSRFNQLFEVHLSERYVRRFASANGELMNDLLNNLEHREIGMLSQHNRTMTTEMNVVIASMMHCTKTGLMKRLYLEAKVLELLMLQLEQFGLPEQSIDTFLKKGDRERLESAKTLLEGDLQKPGSLLDIAHQVGLNDYKLKRGFKELYGTTLFGYWHDLRMMEAQRLLLDDKKPVGEVADAVGYQNAHHFTAAFKKKFGLLPSQLNK